MWPSTSGAGLPTPERTPALSMPAHHSIGRDDRQMLAPAGAESSSQDPQELVQGAKPSPRSGSSRPGHDSELMTQQEVLEREILAWTNAGQDGREEQPDEFKHGLSIADLCSCEVLPSHTAASGSAKRKA